MKIAISILGLMQEYFYTKLSIFIQHIISCTQLTEYLVKWRSIKVNVRFLLISSLRYLTFSSVRAVFGRPQRRYLIFVPLLTNVHQPLYRLLSPSKAFNPFPEILQQLFGIQNHVSALFRFELYLHTIFYP